MSRDYALALLALFGVLRRKASFSLAFSMALLAFCGAEVP
jgi:hypothetical protein